MQTGCHQEISESWVNSSSVRLSPGKRLRQGRTIARSCWNVMKLCWKILAPHSHIVLNPYMSVTPDSGAEICSARVFALPCLQPSYAHKFAIAPCVFFFFFTWCLLSSFVCLSVSIISPVAVPAALVTALEVCRLDVKADTRGQKVRSVTQSDGQSDNFSSLHRTHTHSGTHTPPFAVNLNL